jgi:hypothetical protein
LSIHLLCGVSLRLGSCDNDLASTLRLLTCQVMSFSASKSVSFLFLFSIHFPLDPGVSSYYNLFVIPGSRKWIDKEEKMRMLLAVSDLMVWPAFLFLFVCVPAWTTIKVTTPQILCLPPKSTPDLQSLWAGQMNL